MRKKEGPRQRCSNCGEWTNNPDRQRLRIKARKMILARMAPRKYGNP